VPTIHSEIVSQNLELNDTIHLKQLDVQCGVVDSEDTLYGQGLKKADNIAGYVTSPGTKYLMHTLLVLRHAPAAPRRNLGLQRTDTIWTSFGRYMPPAELGRARRVVGSQSSSLRSTSTSTPAATAWNPANASSSGKWWEDGIKHPEIQGVHDRDQPPVEQPLVGTFLHPRSQRRSLLEDTNNTRASTLPPPPGSVPATPYVPNLGTVSPAVGHSCAIAAVRATSSPTFDNAFTKYYEPRESEYHSDHLTLQPSFTWSHYYGNFDSGQLVVQQRE